MSINVFWKIVAVGLLSTAGITAAAAQHDYFSNWPSGDSPQEIGKKLAEKFVTTPYQVDSTTTIGYPVVCAGMEH